MSLNVKRKPIFYLVRHGESVGNLNHDAYLKMYDHEVPLSPNGLEQAKQAGLELKKMIRSDRTIESIISPYKRTVQTWDVIHKQLVPPGATKIKNTHNLLLREQEWARVSTSEERDRMIQEMREFGPLWYRMKRGESVADVGLRAQTFLNHLRLSYLTGNLSDQVIIVSHAIFLTVLQNMAGVTNKDLNERPTIKNCEIIKAKLF